MLRAIRRRLHLIRYHSAARPSNAWTRALDAALFVTFALAPVVAWASHHWIVLQHDVPYHGQLWTETDGPLTGRLVDPDERDGPWAATAVGEFEVVLPRLERGWPMVLATEAKAPLTRIRLFRSDPELRPIDPVREADEQDAIDAILSREGVADSDAYRAAIEGRDSWSIGRWLAASGLWWVILLAGSAVAIQLARAAWWFATAARRARQETLRRSGRCPSCGYDTRGSIFSERCPECGAVLE